MTSPQTQAFPIRSYSKKELALCYFPDAQHPSTAVNHLMAWIKRCQPLCEKLHAEGYQKTNKWFNPKEVRLIIEHFGEP